MSPFLKKSLIVLPVFLYGIYYLREFYYDNYASTSSKRVTGLVLSAILFLLWVIIIAARKRITTFFQGIVLSSFFVYVFVVLTLTGYFILFRQVSASGWWEDMNERIRERDHVNLEIFHIFKIYSRSDKQVYGNFIMLLPLGIYLPLLYRKLRKFSGFFVVLFICLVSSLAIELLQLATKYRVADIDDVILNVTGGCVGFLLFLVFQSILIKKETVNFTS